MYATDEMGESTPWGRNDCGFNVWQRDTRKHKYVDTHRVLACGRSLTCLRVLYFFLLKKKLKPFPKTHDGLIEVCSIRLLCIRKALLCRLTSWRIVIPSARLLEVIQS